MFVFLHVLSMFNNYSTHIYYQNEPSISNSLKKILNNKEYFRIDEIYTLSVFIALFLYCIPSMMIMILLMLISILFNVEIINMLEYINDELELRKTVNNLLTHTYEFMYTHKEQYNSQDYVIYTCLTISTFIKIISYLPHSIYYNTNDSQSIFTSIFKKIINYYNNYMKIFYQFIHKNKLKYIYNNTILFNNLIFDLLMLFTNNIFLILVKILPHMIILSMNLMKEYYCTFNDEINISIIYSLKIIIIFHIISFISLFLFGYYVPIIVTCIMIILICMIPIVTYISIIPMVILFCMIPSFEPFYIFFSSIMGSCIPLYRIINLFIYIDNFCNDGSYRLSIYNSYVKPFLEDNINILNLLLSPIFSIISLDPLQSYTFDDIQTELIEYFNSVKMNLYDNYFHNIKFKGIDSPKIQFSTPTCQRMLPSDKIY